MVLNVRSGVYSSCKDVVSPTTSGTVMDLLCGAWYELTVHEANKLN